MMNPPAVDSPTKLDQSHLITIIPIFFAYLLGSISSLRTWLAVQELPRAPPTFNITDIRKDSKLSSFRAKFARVLAPFVIGIFLVEFQRHGCEVGLDVLGYLFIGVTFFAMVLVACLDRIGTQLAIHRRNDGALIILPKRSEHPRLWIMIAEIFMVTLLSIGLPIGTLWLHSDVCASAMIFVSLFVFQTQNDAKTITMRKHIISAIMTVVVMLFYISAIAAVIIYRNARATESGHSFPPPAFDQYIFNQWVLVLCLAIPMSKLIGMCIRFDFANHAAKVQAADLSTEPLITLEVVSAPETKSPTEKLTSGVIIPTRVPVTFTRPYFASVLGAWLFANFAVIQAIAHGILHDYGHVVYAVYLLVFAIPMIVATIVVVSVVRGEAKQMWKYEEVWTATPPTAAAVTSGPLEGRGEKDINLAKESDLLV